MKTLKSTFNAYLALALLGQAAAFAFLGLAALAPLREAFAATLGMPPASLWILAAVASLAISVVAFSRLHQALAEPLREVTDQCADGRFLAHSKDSRTREDKILRDYLTQLQDKADERALAIERLEDELFAARKQRDRSQKRQDELEDLLSEYARIRQELSIDNATLRNEKDTLAYALEEQRRSKVGAEVQRRASEIYSQVENALSAAALRSVWIPGLLAEIRAPATIMRDLCRRLLDKWDHLSLGHLRALAEELAEQNRQQLERLEALAHDKQTQAIPFPDPQRSARLPLLDDLQRILDEDQEKRLVLDVADADSLAASLHSERILSFLRSFAHFARNQLPGGRLTLRLRQDEDREAAIEISLSTSAGLRSLVSTDAVSELAQSYGVLTETLTTSDKELRLSFPLERLAQR